MQVDFKIQKYKEVDGKFEPDGEDVYKINFKAGKKWTHLRVCVNDYLSTQVLHGDITEEPKKELIMKAISEYKSGKLKNKTSRYLEIGHLKPHKSASINRRIKNHILTITGEKSRDVLTKFNLIP